MVAGYVVTVWIVVTVVFGLPRALPGDPITASIQDASAVSPELRTMMERRYGLDRPLIEQYGSYLAGLARGDLGESISLRTPVATALKAHLPWTLLLVGTSLALSSLASFIAGVNAAWRRGSFDDRFSVVTMTGLHAIPDYALSIILVIGLAVTVPLFPLGGGAEPFTDDAPLVSRAVDLGYHLVLPAAALSLSLMATKFLILRSAMVSVLGSEYMVAARAKGLSERRLKYRHAGRNALGPFLNLVGIQAGAAVGAAIFIEAVFDYPGMTSLLLPAIGQLDFPLIDGCFLVLALLVLTANLVVDLVQSRIDPRTAG